MALTQAVCNTFKQELLKGSHNFSTGGNTFNMALYTSAATNLNETVVTYAAGTPAGEHAATGTYTAGGKALSIPASMPSITTATAWTDFDDLTWAASTITARAALLYNVTAANKAVVVLDFGSDKTSSAGDFTIQFPAANSTSAIIRIT